MGILPFFIYYPRLQLKMSIYFKQPNEQFYRIFMGMVNVSIDVCETLNGQLLSPLTTAVIKDLRFHSNFFHPCPIMVCDYMQYNVR